MEYSTNISKTKNNLDVVHANPEGYSDILDSVKNDSNTNVIDYTEISSANITNFTRSALEKMPKKECIILIHLTEAFSSVYWNIVFEILKNYGVKKIIWIDGGLTPGYLYRHLNDITILHKTSYYFFTRLLNEKNNFYNKSLIFKDKKYHFVSLGRLTRQERVYLTNKILEDKSKNIIKDEEINGVKLRLQKIDGLPPKELRKLVDKGKKDLGDGIVVVFANKDDKVGLAVGVTDNLTTKFDAVQFVKVGSETIGGKGGGGRKDFAQAGGQDQSKIEEAFEKLESLI